jgi:cation-transporting P-type ATPase G
MADACCGGSPDDEVELTDDDLMWRPIAAAVAAVAWAVGAVAGLAGADDLSPVAAVVAIVVGGSTFVPGAVVGLVRGRVGVALLMTVAGVGAVALGHLGEAAALAFLFSVSEALEEWAIVRARRGLRDVLSLAPDRVRVQRDGAEVEIPTGDVVVGDVVVLRAGDRLAVDGVVADGESSLDVSAVTGESIPIECGPGVAVVAGSINSGGGHLHVTAAAVAGDSTLARIVRSVEEARERRGTSQRLADRIARPLVPAIIVVASLVAGLGALFGDPGLWFGRALVVLVAASPCAFAIAVPVTAFAAIGAATRSGVVVKGGAALEQLAAVRTVALDKTGTLTRNRPAVVDVVAVDGIDRDRVLGIAAALEAHSDHPLAAAICAAGASAGVATEVHTESGLGVTGQLDGVTVRIGSARFVHLGPLEPSVGAMQRTGASVVVVEHDGAPIGAIAVRDEPRPEAAAVVDRLHSMGVRVVMLTGDHEATASAIAAETGIDEVRAGLMPDDKRAMVAELRSGGPVAMVGDGINDAPALAAADVGLAMGALGSDVAIETADIAIMGDRLTHLPGLLAHARRTRRIMTQNLVLSGLIIGILVPIATFGVLGLGVVVAVHEIAEIVVIGNGLRARRLAPDRSSPDSPRPVRAAADAHHEEELHVRANT